MGKQRAEKVWGELGFRAEESARWRDKGFGPSEALEWSMQWECWSNYPHRQRSVGGKFYELSASEAARWRGHGFTPEEAVAWIEEGHIDCGEGGVQEVDGLLLSATGCWCAPDATANEAAAWRTEGFGADEGPAWRGLGISPEEAAEWRGVEFDGVDAREWMLVFGVGASEEADAWSRAGWDDPYDALAWHEKLYSVDEARQLREDGLTSSDVEVAKGDVD